MNFRRGASREEPEINLIPLIDLFLVIIIFLMVTTTYSKFSELQITLPTADADKALQRPAEINIGVTQDGHYSIDNQLIPVRDASTASADLAEALKSAAANRKDPIIIINADALSTHQAVVNVMEAARLAQLSQITFATQIPTGGK
jgi:biopolymer transport protein ExbD